MTTHKKVGISLKTKNPYIFLHIYANANLYMGLIKNVNISLKRRNSYIFLHIYADAKFIINGDAKKCRHQF